MLFNTEFRLRPALSSRSCGLVGMRAATHATHPTDEDRYAETAGRSALPIKHPLEGLPWGRTKHGSIEMSQQEGWWPARRLGPRRCIRTLVSSRDAAVPGLGAPCHTAPVPPRTGFLPCSPSSGCSRCFFPPWAAPCQRGSLLCIPVPQHRELVLNVVMLGFDLTFVVQLML